MHHPVHVSSNDGSAQQVKFTERVLVQPLQQAQCTETVYLAAEGLALMRELIISKEQRISDHTACNTAVSITEPRSGWMAI